MKKIIISAILAVAAVSAQAESVTKVFTVSPVMHCQNCEKKIQSNLRFEKGVQDIVIDRTAQTVTVKFDDKKTDAAKIAAALKKLGYTATEKSEKKK